MDSIGSKLSSARRNKGIGLKEAEDATKIRLRFIEALENDDFDVLPGPVYVKGFIRSYAGFLKIDPRPLVEAYKKIEPEVSSAREKFETPVQIGQRGRSASPRKLTIPAALVTVILFMTLFLGYLGYLDTVQSSKFSNKKYGVKELKKLEKSHGKKSLKGKAKKNTSNTNLFKTKIEVTSNTWVRIKAQNKTFFSKYVKAGEAQTFISRKPLEITAGKGSFVKIYVDGKEKGTVSQRPTFATKIYKK